MEESPRLAMLRRQQSRRPEIETTRNVDMGHMVDLGSNNGPIRPGQACATGFIFENAKRALAAATTIVEVTDVRAKAIGLTAYAVKASDRQLAAEATAI